MSYPYENVQCEQCSKELTVYWVLPDGISQRLPQDVVWGNCNSNSDYYLISYKCPYCHNFGTLKKQK